MNDIGNRSTRSYIMSCIKGKNTKPEILVRKFLFGEGFRYRLFSNKLPGKPDIVLPKYKTVILVNGCFWHGHQNCQYFKIPKTRTEWWFNKIEKTKNRDKGTIAKLKEAGWEVIIIWECELKKDRKEITLLQTKNKLLQAKK